MRTFFTSTKIFLSLIVVLMLLTPNTTLAYTPSKDKITKAEFVAKISQYFSWPHPNDYNDIWKAPLKQFGDVKTSDKYGMEIEAAYEEGIISPDASGNFNPQSEISRQDAAVILFKVFKLNETDKGAMFSDNATIRPDARASVNTLADLGYMDGKTAKLFKPNDPISKSEVDKVFNAIISNQVTPVQALPKQNTKAPRRYIKLYTPTPDATIYFTRDGTTPTTESEVYNVDSVGYINENSINGQEEREVIYKAIAVKDGMVTSQVQTFIWNLHRPIIDDFQHEIILEKTKNSPAVYKLFNDSDPVRPMAWYIEGESQGILFDALQTNHEAKNLKEYIDKNIAKTPYSVVIGHTHGDHVAQAPNFLDDHNVYINKRGWSDLVKLIPKSEDQAKIKNIDDGDVFDLGGSKLYAHALPGHHHADIILQDKENGLIFSSDFYGCTRAGSADNVNVSGVRADLLLSLVQQTYSNYQKDGKSIMLFTGHDEFPLADINLRLFEAALQQVIDKGEDGTTPTLRGGNDAPNSRTTMIGDMWADGTQWISLKLAGIKGDNTEYLTSNPVNYNGKDGHLKYSVLSNVLIEGGELIGKKVQWAPDSEPFDWADSTMHVENSLPNKFLPWSYDYTIKVPKANNNITIIPTTISTQVKSVTLNGKKVKYQSRNSISVSNGSVITIEVVAPDNVTKSTYKFTIEKI